MSSPRIAIVGAGPGGLTLASLLQHNGMQCTIFELDKDRSTRSQGGIIDLHPESGQLALREAGLFEEFEKHLLPGAEAMKLIRSNGAVRWDENSMEGIETGPARNRPEIDRTTLRTILLDSIDPASIHWGKKLVRVEANETHRDKYNLHFTDGRELGFDLVVGADGAWSKVRLLLTEQLPIYSGITLLDMKAEEVSTKKQWLENFTGSGSCFMFDEGRALICQRNGNDSIRIYAAVRQPETWVNDCGIDWQKPALARKDFMERCFGDCHEDLKRVIAVEASDGLIARPLFMLPIGFKWEPHAGVTLLGDAAHLMTPFAGVGVNVALADALSLARALVKRKGGPEADLKRSLAEALQEYEGPMFERAKENMNKTWIGLNHHFSADGIEERVRRLQARTKQIEEWKARQRKAGESMTV